MLCGLGVPAQEPRARPVPTSGPVGSPLFNALLGFDEPRVAESLSFFEKHVQASVAERLATGAHFHSKLKDPGNLDHFEQVELRQRQQIERAIVTLLAGRDVQAEAVVFVTQLAVSYEWEGYPDAPMAEAASAVDYLKAHPNSRIRPFIRLLLLDLYRCVFEAADRSSSEGFFKTEQSRQEYVGTLRSLQMTVATLYRQAWASVRAESDVVVKAVAEDIDGQQYMNYPTAEHPRTFGRGPAQGPALAAWDAQSVGPRRADPIRDGSDTIAFAYFLNDTQKSIGDCTFGIVQNGNAPVTVAVDGERLRVGVADGKRQLEFRCGDYPPDESASIDLVPGTERVVFAAYSPPQSLDKNLKRDDSRWSEVLSAFYDAREELRGRWLKIPRSARQAAGGAFSWRAATGSTTTVSTTIAFRYSARPQQISLPGGLAGSWTVVRKIDLSPAYEGSILSIAVQNSDMSPATPFTEVGAQARFGNTTAKVGAETCTEATYRQMTVDPEKYFVLMFGYSVKKFDLAKNTNLVGVVCADARWIVPVAFILRDKNHVLAFGRDAVFEMARAN
jgi:hypothetical protein